MWIDYPQNMLQENDHDNTSFCSCWISIAHPSQHDFNKRMVVLAHAGYSRDAVRFQFQYYWMHKNALQATFCIEMYCMDNIHFHSYCKIVLSVILGIKYQYMTSELYQNDVQRPPYGRPQQSSRVYGRMKKPLRNCGIPFLKLRGVMYNEQTINLSRHMTSRNKRRTLEFIFDTFALIHTNCRQTFDWRKFVLDSLINTSK